MSVPAAADLGSSSSRALWKDSSLDSIGTHICGPVRTDIRVQCCAEAAGSMAPIQGSSGPVGCIAEVSAHSSSRMWPSLGQMGADSFIVPGQRQQQPPPIAGNFAGDTAGTTAAATAAAAAVTENLDSDDEDFEVCKLVPERGSTASAAVEDAAGAASAPNIKQFTASSRKLLTSKYRGVCWNKKNKRWQAAINSGGKYIYLGSFQSEDDAARQFDRAAIKIRGKKAKTNFAIKNYMDADGNLIDDVEIPLPGSSNSSSKSAANSTASKSPPQPSQQRQQQQQAEEPQPQDSVLAGYAVNAAACPELGFGVAEAGVNATAEVAGIPWQQQQGRLWAQEQGAPLQREQQQQLQGPLLWQQYKQQHQQQHQQQQHSGPLLKSHWQQQQQQQQAQHAQQLQLGDVAAFAAPLCKSRSLPANTTVNAAMNFSVHSDVHSSTPMFGTASASGSEIANQAAMILMQRRRISQEGGCLMGNAGPAPGMPGFLHMPVEAMTKRMTNDNVTDGMTNPTSTSSMQQQQQLMRPELTVAQLELPPVLPLEPGSFGSFQGNEGGSSRPQQQLPMPQGPDTYNPHAVPWQQQQQYQQQQQQQFRGFANSCITTPSPVNFSDMSCATAAQEYARSLGVAMPSTGSGAHHATPSAAASSAGPLNNSSSMQLPAAAAAAARNLMHGTGPSGFAHSGFRDGQSSRPPPPGALNGVTPGPLSEYVIPGPVAGVTAGPAEGVTAGPGAHIVTRAPAVTRALSVRMASCDLAEALALAQQAAAEQGVADLASALRQMSSGTLGRPVASASNSAGTTNSAGVQLQQQLSTGRTHRPHQQQQHQQQHQNRMDVFAAATAVAPDGVMPSAQLLQATSGQQGYSAGQQQQQQQPGAGSNALHDAGFPAVHSVSTGAAAAAAATITSGGATSRAAAGNGVAGSPPNKTNWPGAATGASAVDGQAGAPSNKRVRMTSSSACSD